MSVTCCCLAQTVSEVNPVIPTLLMSHPRLAQMPSVVHGARVVLGSETEQHAADLLQAGAGKVFLGDAALLDSSVVTRLAQRFGQERLGLHVTVQRQAVSWSFETESNADFSVVTPSLCEPVWEVLRANGSASDVRAKAWMQAMAAHGIDEFLLRADIADDTDLNLCADMTETFARGLWMAPRSNKMSPFTDWVTFGRVTQLALPTPLYAQRHRLLSQAEVVQTHPVRV